jgi:hypothetical protein
MPDSHARSIGIAWLVLCLGLALHTYDEAVTGFLDVYNPTVTALRANLGWWPMPTYTYQSWLQALIFGCAIVFLVAIPLFAGVRWIRIPAALFAGLMLVNACGHTLFSILGRTVATVQFARPAPGFWSSPFMAAAAIYFLVQVRRAHTAKLSGLPSA